MTGERPLPPFLPEDPTLRRQREAADRLHLLRTLELSRWNQREAARLLGISRYSLHRLIRRHRILSSTGDPRISREKPLPVEHGG